MLLHLLLYLIFPYVISKNTIKNSKIKDKTIKQYIALNHLVILSNIANLDQSKEM